MRRRWVLTLCAATASMALLPVAGASSSGAEAAAVPCQCSVAALAFRRAVGSR